MPEKIGVGRPFPRGHGLVGALAHRLGRTQSIIAISCRGPFSGDNARPWCRPPHVGVLVAALGGAAIGVEQCGPCRRSAPRLAVSAPSPCSAWLPVWLAGVDTRRFMAAVCCCRRGRTGDRGLRGGQPIRRRRHDRSRGVGGCLAAVSSRVSAMCSWPARSLPSRVCCSSRKSRLHGWGRADRHRDLRAAARFAVMALVVLPLLPRAVRATRRRASARALALVLFFSASASWDICPACRRSVAGYLLGGLAGGLLSSTNVPGLSDD